MSRIAINDLNPTDSPLIDLSDSNLQGIMGGQKGDLWIVVVRHGDHYHVYLAVEQ